MKLAAPIGAEKAQPTYPVSGTERGLMHPSDVHFRQAFEKAMNSPLAKIPEAPNEEEPAEITYFSAAASTGQALPSSMPMPAPNTAQVWSSLNALSQLTKSLAQFGKDVTLVRNNSFNRTTSYTAALDGRSVLTAVSSDTPSLQSPPTSQNNCDSQIGHDCVPAYSQSPSKINQPLSEGIKPRTTKLNEVMWWSKRLAFLANLKKVENSLLPIQEDMLLELEPSHAFPVINNGNKPRISHPQRSKLMEQIAQKDLKDSKRRSRGRRPTSVQEAGTQTRLKHTLAGTSGPQQPPVKAANITGEHKIVTQAEKMHPAHKLEIERQY